MKVALFVTCLVDQLKPEVGEATVRVLRRAGCEVTFDPRQTCCAQPAFNTGYRDEARTVARGARRQVSGVGLIHTQQGKVARAKALTGEPLDRIYGYAVRASLTRLREANEMRRVVETGIARLAAERRDPKGISALAAAVQTMHDTLGQPDRFTEADIAFHLGMALATGNAMIRMQVEGMRSVQREVSELFSQRSNRTLDDWRDTVRRHVALFQAIRDGDPDRAVQLIDAHYQAADIASLEVAGDMDGADG